MTYRSDDPAQQKRIEKAMMDIAVKGGHEYIYRQLAEECAELTQAALKLVRASKNETPATVSEVYDNVLEEIADVRVMLDIMESAVLNEKSHDRISEIYHSKLNRMRERVLPL